MAPDTFQKLWDAVTQYKADAAFGEYMAVPNDASLEDMPSFRKKPMPLIKWNKKVLECNQKELTDRDRMDLMCYPIGGNGTGLWRKRILLDNDLFFPEYLRYEDNYWGSMVKCYLDKVCFIEEVVYFYRQNPNSTVHANNQRYHYDRITVEKRLLQDAKKRGLLKRFYSAFEFLYISRYVQNTYNVLLFLFDEFDSVTAKTMINDLKKNFPEWSKNHYWNEIATSKQKLKFSLIMRFPRLMAIVLKRKVGG